MKILTAKDEQFHRAVIESERALRKSLARANDQACTLEELLGFRSQLKLLPGDETEIASGLQLVDERHPVWMAVHRLIDVMERDEQTVALRPAQSAEDRAYNNGRAACVADVRAMLLQQWVKARESRRAAL